MQGTGNPEVDRQLSKIMTQLEQFADLQQQMAELKGVGEAADGLISVEVGPTGNFVGVTINPRAMRLDSQTLTEAINEAAQLAAKQVSERAKELMEPLMGNAGSAFGQQLTGQQAPSVIGAGGDPTSDPVAEARRQLEKMRRPL